MSLKVKRNYLEIYSIDDLIDVKIIPNEFKIELNDPPNFQLNKFFYKNIGKNYRWIDRLLWNDNQWINYATNKNLKTYILKNKNDLAGYFELIYHLSENEVEIAYLGLLEEYHNKKLGSYLLSIAIKESFLQKPKRVWVHTCSLDHKNALNNYLSRGMKVFMTETVQI